MGPSSMWRRSLIMMTLIFSGSILDRRDSSSMIARLSNSLISPSRNKSIRCSKSIYTLEMSRSEDTRSMKSISLEQEIRARSISHSRIVEKHFHSIAEMDSWSRLLLDQVAGVGVMEGSSSRMMRIWMSWRLSGRCPHHHFRASSFQTSDVSEYPMTPNEKVRSISSQIIVVSSPSNPEVSISSSSELFGESHFWLLHHTKMLGQKSLTKNSDSSNFSSYDIT